MLATLLSLSFATLPQNGEAGRPEGLTVVVADVGQGDAVVIRAPDGTVHCYDGGPNGQGAVSALPVVNGCSRRRTITLGAVYALGGAALGHGQRWSIFGIAYGTQPGFPLLGVVVPLNLDPLLAVFLGIPGTFAPLPAEGYRSLFVELPSPNPLANVPLYAAHVALDLSSLTVADLSSAMPFVLQ